MPRRRSSKISVSLSYSYVSVFIRADLSQSITATFIHLDCLQFQLNQIKLILNTTKKTNSSH